MKTVFASAIAGLLLYGAIAHGETPPEQMQFRALPPTNADAIRGGNAWMIAADGVIDAGAANRLQGLLDLHRIPGHSVLAINSPGGSVLAAMELGKIIRKFDLYTSVGIARTTCGKPQSGFALCSTKHRPVTAIPRVRSHSWADRFATQSGIPSTECIGSTGISQLRTEAIWRRCSLRLSFNTSEIWVLILSFSAK